MTKKRGRPKLENRQRITVPKSRAEFLKVLANFSSNTYNKAKELILKALK